MPPSAAFCAFWQNDITHDRFLSYTNTEDQQSLRLVCKPFAEDIASTLFNHITIKFNANSFSRQARMNALDRIGHHFKHVTFSMPHTLGTFLPPLLDPETGEEQTFLYRPEHEITGPSEARSSLTKFGDWDITNLLVQQYPPTFHSATNVAAYIRAFSRMTEMESLTISSPDQQPEQRYRRSVVDYALITLRMALEHVCPPKLDTLVLAPIHSSAVYYLRPFISVGSSPRSTRIWRRIISLTINIDSHSSCPNVPNDLYKILHTYLSTFTSLENLNFTWLGTAGPMPLSLHTEPSLLRHSLPPRPVTPPCSPPGAYPPSPPSSLSSSPSSGPCPLPLFSNTRHTPRHPKPTLRPLELPNLQTFHLTNSLVDSAAQVASFINTHRRTLREFSFHDTNLLKGSWNDALAPLTRISGNEEWKNVREKCWSYTPTKPSFNPTTPSPSSSSQSSTTHPRHHHHQSGSATTEEEEESLEVPFLLSAPLVTPTTATTTNTTPPTTSSSATSTSSSSSARNALNQKPLPIPFPNELVEGPLWDTLIGNTLGCAALAPAMMQTGGGKRRVLMALGRALGRIVGGCGAVACGGGHGEEGGRKREGGRKLRRKDRRSGKRRDDQDEWEEWWLGNWDGLVNENDEDHEVTMTK